MIKHGNQKGRNNYSNGITILQESFSYTIERRFKQTKRFVWFSVNFILNWIHKFACKRCTRYNIMVKKRVFCSVFFFIRNFLFCFCWRVKIVNRLCFPKRKHGDFISLTFSNIYKGYNWGKCVFCGTC